MQQRVHTGVQNKIRRFTKPASWPRYMVEKPGTKGAVAYYWRPPGRDLANGCILHAEALGSEYALAVERAKQLNMHLDAWQQGSPHTVSIDFGSRYGTVDWWIERFTRTDAFNNLSERSQDDYREVLGRIAEIEALEVDPPTRQLPEPGGR